MKVLKSGSAVDWIPQELVCGCGAILSIDAADMMVAETPADYQMDKSYYTARIICPECYATIAPALSQDLLARAYKLNKERARVRLARWEERIKWVDAHFDK